jgi:SAM-dependent methyltransferase
MRNVLYELIFGYQDSQMLGEITRLNIPDLLAEQPQAADCLAAALGLDPGALYRVLRTLAQRGIFKQEADGSFALTPIGALLRNDAEGSLRPLMLAQTTDWKWKSWGRLRHTLQTGGTGFEVEYGARFYDYLDKDPAMAAAFNNAMAKRTEHLTEAVLSAWDFSSARHLVEIGCGRGALAAAILREYPGLEATLLDLPKTLAEAAEVLAAGVSGRARYIAGSFLDSVPEGGDTYLIKNVILDWGNDQVLALLRNCRRAMADHAKLLLFERVFQANNPQVETLRTDLHELVVVGGMERTAEQFRHLLEAAGFCMVKVSHVAATISLIEAAPR